MRETARSAVDAARSAGRSAGAAARAATATAQALCTRSALAALGTEVAWVAAHTALYPLGMLAEGRPPGRESLGRFTLSDLPPVQRGLLLRDVVAAGTPILLVHGLVDNRSVFTVLARALRRRGFSQVRTVNYSPFTSDVRVAAAGLGALVERTCEETGYDQVHVVGHSLGGVVARYYVQRLGGSERVHTLCTLGSPHAGTWAAHLLPHSLVRQLRPGSDLVQELAAPAPGCRTRVVSFWSDLDHMVVPQGNARLEHPDLAVRNVLLRGVGHTSLPIDGRVVRAVAAELARLDEPATAGARTVATPA